MAQLKDLVVTGNANFNNQLILGYDPTTNLQAATKQYVDQLVANATHFCGSFNASTGAINGGSTTLTSIAEKVGDMYTCDTAGTYLNVAYEVGDSIIFKNNVAAATAPVATDLISVEKTVSVTQTLTSGTKIGTVEGVDLYCQTNTDTYRAIQVNGSDKLGTATSTGKVNFANGTNTTVVFTAASGNTPAKIQIDATDTNTAQATGTETFVKGDSTFTWSAGTLPTLGTAISADDITSWSAGTLSSLVSSTYTVPNVTGVGTLPTATVSNGVLTFGQGTLPTLGTAFSITGVSTWSAGTLPSLSYTSRSIPNVTAKGTLPALSWSTASAVTGVST